MEGYHRSAGVCEAFFCSATWSAAGLTLLSSFHCCINSCSLIVFSVWFSFSSVLWKYASNFWKWFWFLSVVFLLGVIIEPSSSNKTSLSRKKCDYFFDLLWPSENMCEKVKNMSWYEKFPPCNSAEGGKSWNTKHQQSRKMSKIWSESESVVYDMENVRGRGKCVWP